MSQQPRRFPGHFWTAFFTGVLAASTLVALIVAFQQLKEFHAESQIQHLLALEQQFDQEPMLSYRRGLAEKRLKNQDEPDELYAVLDFFETVGLLVKRGYLNESDVWNTFAIDVFTLNSDERQVIEQQRRKDPTHTQNSTFWSNVSHRSKRRTTEWVLTHQRKKSRSIISKNCQQEKWLRGDANKVVGDEGEERWRS